MADETSPPSDDDMAELIHQLDQWKETEYARLKAEHNAQYGDQLPLLQPVEGVDMVQVRDFLLQLLAIERMREQVQAREAAVYATMKDRGFPVKSIRGAMRIARAILKRDSSQQVLQKCVELALSVLIQPQTVPPDAEED